MKQIYISYHSLILSRQLKLKSCPIEDNDTIIKQSQ